MMRFLPNAATARRMDTTELREHFLVSALFVSGTIFVRAVDLGRVVLGSAVPLGEALMLPNPTALRAEYFCERREIGVLNVGGAGQVAVDAQTVALAAAETRTLVVRDGKVALSPGWSVHSGCGTRAYSFRWAMGGENQDYADMDAVAMETLR